MKKRHKEKNLLKRIANCIATGRYLDTQHVVKRQAERIISRTEVLYVLKHGMHEAIKDTFDEYYDTWNYAIRGKTIDDRLLRIIVSFDDNNLLIITAIDLEN